MAKTVHVYPSDDGWVVKQEGAKTSGVFTTQKEAIESARVIVRDSVSSQMVVHGRDGRIREHLTHGLPRVQDPPGKRGRAKSIEKAVGRVALERVTADLHSPRG